MALYENLFFMVLLSHVADINSQGSLSLTRFVTSKASISRYVPIVRARDISPCKIHIK